MSTEGKAPFQIEGVSAPCHTWYKVFGDINDASKIPLFLLHGGPTTGHEYLLSLSTITDVVILYDQIGCAQSSEIPEKDGDQNFWTSQLFIKELENLLAHLGLKDRPIDVLGHSWGGMFASEWASDPVRAKNLRRLVLYGVPASMQRHVKSLNKLRESLPTEARDAIAEGLGKKEYTSEAFQKGVGVFGQRHLSVTEPFPRPEIIPGIMRMGSSKVFATMFGANMFEPTGSLQYFSSEENLSKIAAPTLMISGSQEYIREEVMQPFFDQIPKVKWITFNDAAHFSHLERTDAFTHQVGGFLRS